MKAMYVRTPAELRRWLAAHHREAEVLVGFYKRASGKAGLTYQQALDEALCFGWIDGVRRGVDDERYTIRFTPRKPTSYWSAVNTRRARELIRLGRMRPPGPAAFELRDESATKRYSFEQANPRFTPGQEKALKADRKAWAFFRAKAPSYRRAATWWVVSAKKDETRASRLAALIDRSATGSRLPQLGSPARRPPKS